MSIVRKILPRLRAEIQQEIMPLIHRKGPTLQYAHHYVPIYLNKTHGTSQSVNLLMISVNFQFLQTHYRCTVTSPRFPNHLEFTQWQAAFRLLRRRQSETFSFWSATLSFVVLPLHTSCTALADCFLNCLQLESPSCKSLHSLNLHPFISVLSESNDSDTIYRKKKNQSLRSRKSIGARVPASALYLTISAVTLPNTPTGNLLVTQSHCCRFHCNNQSITASNIQHLLASQQSELQWS